MARRLAAASLLLATAILAGCGFNDPSAECQELDDARCQSALETALTELGTSWGDYDRIAAHPGCHAEITCPPSMLELRVTVVLYPRDGSAPTYVAVDDDGQVRLYTPAPSPSS